MICQKCGERPACNVVTIWCGVTGKQYAEAWCLLCLRRFLRFWRDKEIQHAPR